MFRSLTGILHFIVLVIIAIMLIGLGAKQIYIRDQVKEFKESLEEIKKDLPINSCYKDYRIHG